MDYIFLPWVQQKLYPLATGIPDRRGRPSLTAQAKVSVTGGGDPDLTATIEEFQLMGPGDVVGVQPAAVIRTVPKEGEREYSPLLLAAVEFYEEDFPWRYSPVWSPVPTGSAEQRRPWCTLLVLEDGEFELLNQATAPLPSIQVKNDTVFPDFTTLWAWAHVQALQPVPNTSTFLNEDLPQEPDLAYARLFSPRRLKPNAGYTGFVIPSFEAGRLAGLGLEPAADPQTALGPAWGNPSQPLPIYYRWSFRTGPEGDFESLARLLRPTTAGALQNTGPSVTFPVPGPSPTTYPFTLPTAIQGLGQTQIPTVSRPVAKVLARTLQQPVSDADNPLYQRPLLTAPVYGRTYHATGAQVMSEQTLGASAAPTVDPTSLNWKDRANLDIAYRAVTALGSQHVQDNQEAYMLRAWDQVQDVLVANENLRNMQRALQTTSRLRATHLPLTGVGAAMRAATPGSGQGASLENYGLHLTGLALRRLRVPSTGLSVYETIRRSQMPLAVFSPAFRRITRPFGPYQIAMAGRPLRPDEPEPAHPETLLEGGTSLRQRDSLLSLVAEGKVTGAEPKHDLVNMYQFNDAVVDAVLNQIKQDQAIVPLYYQDGNSVVRIEHSVAWQQALSAFTAPPGVRFTPPKTDKPPLALEEVKEVVVAGTDPEPVLLKRASRALRLEAHYPGASNASLTGGNSQPLARGLAARTFPALTSLNQVMAYPVFKESVSEELQKVHPELFLPGLKNFPNNAIAAFEVNHQFVESYLLGLNHAMGSELLWRGYPTDVRGSYFRQFWNPYEFISLTTAPDPALQRQAEEDQRDVTPLHQWAATSKLGAHLMSSSTNVVLLAIRADVLRRYPNTIICARVAVSSSNGLVPDPNPLVASVFPSKRLDTGSDLVILCFDLDPQVVTGNPGYFFLIMERPGQLQFGLDQAGADVEALQSWDDLNWDGMGIALGGNMTVSATKPKIQDQVPPAAEPVRTIQNGAQAAYAFVQKPYMVAIHASELI